MSADAADRPRYSVPPPVPPIAALVSIVVLDQFAPVSFLPHRVALAVGIPLLVLGLGLWLWGMASLSRRGESPDPFKPTGQVLTGGALRVSRNPIYTGGTHRAPRLGAAPRYGHGRCGCCRPRAHRAQPGACGRAVPGAEVRRRVPRLSVARSSLALATYQANVRHRVRNISEPTAAEVKLGIVDAAFAGLVGTVVGAVISVAGTGLWSTAAARDRARNELRGALALVANELEDNARRLKAHAGAEALSEWMTFGNWDRAKPVFYDLRYRDVTLWDAVVRAEADLFDFKSRRRRDPPSADAIDGLWRQVETARKQLDAEPRRPWGVWRRPGDP